MKTRNSFFAVIAAFALASCSGGALTIGGRTDDAQAIAKTAQLVRQDLTAPPFILASWQRITDPSAPVNIYIEGDGAAWLNRTTPSRNPTPRNALALKLAARDPAPNVVYLARPCQFTNLGAAGNDCRDYYWRSGRFAPEVIQSFNTALDKIADQTNHSGFNLIGFSGGANVAGLLAERRTDIATIRTVSGNIDNEAFVNLHKVSPMPVSLNMADHASALSKIPQIHFIGADDKIVPPAIFQSYLRESDNAPCVQSKILSGISHEKGWEQNWRSMLAKPFACKMGAE